MEDKGVLAFDKEYQVMGMVANNFYWNYYRASIELQTTRNTICGGF